MTTGGVTHTGLDGRLRKATRLKGIEGFRAADNGLLPLQVGTWGELVFIRLGQQDNGSRNSRGSSQVAKPGMSYKLEPWVPVPATAPWSQ